MVALADVILAVWYFLPVMGLILVASTAVFVVLVRRWTVLREQTKLHLWAREADYRLIRPPYDRLMKMIPAQLRSAIRIDQVFCRRETWLIRSMPDDSSSAPHHLLLRRLSVDWPTTALKPAAGGPGLIDLVSLRHFPALSTPNRFGVYASTAAGARVLATSPVLGLLPPDLGLLLEGGVLLLDFSSRPFDPIELDRMDVLVDQLEHHLPVIQPIQV